jgi:hypothetical protein
MRESSSGRSAARPVESYRPPALHQAQNLRQLLAEWPIPGDGRFGCYLIANSSPFSDLARGVECCVFQQFFGNDPAIMSEEYAGYEAQSSFFLVVDRQLQQTAGACRVIENSAHGLKTLNDIAREPLSISRDRVTRFHGIATLDACWDVSSVAVLKEYRGGGTGHLVSTMLYGLLRAEASSAGIDHFVAVLDTHAFHQIVDTLGVPFVSIAGSAPFAYLGSDSSIAAYVSVSRITPSIEAHMRRLKIEVLQQRRPLMERVAYAASVPAIVRVT